MDLRPSFHLGDGKCDLYHSMPFSKSGSVPAASDSPATCAADRPSATPSTRSLTSRSSFFSQKISRFLILSSSLRLSKCRRAYLRVSACSLSLFLCSFTSWRAFLSFWACFLLRSASGTAPRVRPLCSLRNTFRSRAMPKALLNRKTGKATPLLYNPFVPGPTQKATHASADCQTAEGSTDACCRHGN